MIVGPWRPKYHIKIQIDSENTNENGKEGGGNYSSRIRNAPFVERPRTSAYTTGNLIKKFLIRYGLGVRNAEKKNLKNAMFYVDCVMRGCIFVRSLNMARFLGIKNVVADVLYVDQRIQTMIAIGVRG